MHEKYADVIDSVYASSPRYASLIARLASNDPTDTGGLFVGRRPGTAPVRYRDGRAGVASGAGAPTRCSRRACSRSSCCCA